MIDSKKRCITNTDDLDRLEHKFWNCSEPNPIGRTLIIYFTGVRVVTFKEIKAFGVEIKNDDFYELNLINANYNNEVKPERPYSKYPRKIIDKNYANYFPSKYSISMIEVENHAESHVTVYLDGLQRIEQIVVILIQNSGLFVKKLGLKLYNLLV